MLTVIVVEDEYYLRKALVVSTNWKRFGCQVIADIGSAVDGIAVIPQLKPDIVITDIKMPEMSGLEMIENLHNKVDCKFILISGYDDFQFAQQALKYGVKGYLLKPLDDDELEKTLLRTISVIKEERRQKIVQVRMNQLGASELPLWKLPDFSQKDGKDKYIHKAIAFMSENCHIDITIEDVAKNLNISSSYLSKLLRNSTNYTFLLLLTEIRVYKATELLKNENIKVYEVSNMVGYKDSRYFSGVFKKILGMTPSEYRNYTI